MLWFAIMKSQSNGPPHAVEDHNHKEVLENLKEYLIDELGPKERFTNKEVFEGLETAFYKYISDFNKRSIYID